MARLPRLTLPGLPHHVIQRGNNGQPIFACAADREMLLALLADHAAQCEVVVHAYVLMDNHFHLLATPKTANALSKMMQALGRRYVRYFNDTQHRTGTLWDGRYRSTVIQAERYLLACMVYIDLNPVRAGLVSAAREYPWSSHAYYVGLKPDPLVTPHHQFWHLGNTPFAREAAYAALVQAGVGTTEQSRLTDATLAGWALGDAGFIAEVQKRTTRRVARANPGRPPKLL